MGQTVSGIIGQGRGPSVAYYPFKFKHEYIIAMVIFSPIKWFKRWYTSTIYATFNPIPAQIIFKNISICLFIGSKIHAGVCHRVCPTCYCVVAICAWWETTFTVLPFGPPACNDQHFHISEVPISCQKEGSIDQSSLATCTAHFHHIRVIFIGKWDRITQPTFTLVCALFGVYTLLSVNTCAIYNMFNVLTCIECFLI